MSRKKVWDLINKKKHNAAKCREARKAGPVQIVADFMNAVETASVGSHSVDAFYIVLEREKRKLNDRMKRLDCRIELKIMWNDEDKLNRHNSWRDLRVDGVHIIWSDSHLQLNPNKEPERFIDMTQLFIEGYLD